MPLARAHNDGAAVRRPPGARARRGVTDSQTKNVAGIGAKLKSARERNGVSVRGLARSVDVSPSLVSQIEHGLVMPSVGTLYAMVSELGLGLDELFQRKPKPSNDGRAAPVEEARSPLRRRNSREVIRLAGGVRWELLTAEPDPELEFLYVVYEAGAESCDKDLLVRHGGMEYAYIISGRLRISVGFSEYELGPGDSISFDAQNPHRLWNVGRKPAVAIWAVLKRSGDKRTRQRHWVRAAQSGKRNAAPHAGKSRRRR